MEDYKLISRGVTDMVEAEEEKQKIRKDAIHEQEGQERRDGKVHHKKKDHHDDQKGGK